MKNIKNKVIISILIMIALLMVASNIYATITIDGVTYYTADDISWSGNKIHVKGKGEFWCINHNVALKKGLGDNTNLSPKETKSYIENFKGLPTMEEMDYKRYELPQRIATMREEFISEQKGIIDSGNNKTATIKDPNLEDEPDYGRSPIESAIYAFAKEFNPSNYDICNSIWNYESSLDSTKCGVGEDNDLWRAVNAYVTWANPKKISDGKYETQNKPGLKIDSSKAKVNYTESNCIVGPLEVSYKAGSKYKNISFTKNFQITVKDQNGNKINSLKIMDLFGDELQSIRNGDEFFLEFPYTGNITNININVGLEYINTVYGESRTWYTTVQTWTYELVNETNEPTYYTYATHRTNNDKEGKEYPATQSTHERAGNCLICYPDKKPSGNPNHPVCDDYGKEEMIAEDWVFGTDEIRCSHEKSFSDYYCTLYMQSHFRHEICLDVEAKLTKVKEESGVMQNMRQFDGTVTWATETASTSLEVERDMDIAGYVWEDGEQGKASEINGSKDLRDTMLEGIEVRLYDANGTLAKVEGTNPVLTDKNGYYEFKKVDATKKYFVVFTYDGMIYTNTYGAGKPEYNTAKWNASSKGSELVSERNSFNTRFVTIGSYPKGYSVPVAIFTGNYLTDGYNKVFDINDADVQYYKNEITKQLRSYLATNKRLEDGRETYVKAIYDPIVNNSSDKTKAKQILQYIWDCRINSYAGYESEENGQTTLNGLYPYYSKILLARDMVSDKQDQINGYYFIYNGQLNVNQGLIKRDHTNLELSEDVAESLVSINGKDEVYKYGALSEKEINLLTSDWKQYTQNVAPHDYNYKTESASLSSDLSETAEYPNGYAPIEIYVTYKIKVKNRSNIPTTVDEIATYFDTQYYSYSDSYTTTQGKSISGIRAAYISDNTETDLDVGITANTTSRYGTSSETGKPLGTDMYISLNDKVILENEESIAIYVTYKLGGNSTKDAKYNCTYNNGRGNAAYVILQDNLEDSDAKLEINKTTEINGFSTYHEKTSESAKTQSKYTYTNIGGYNYRPAGVLDVNSMPGNLTTTEINTAQSNKGKSLEDRTPIEDDWDNAATFIFEKSGSERTLTGNVWETVGQDASAWVDQYALYNSSYKVEGITVELIEIKNGQEYIRAATSTDADGKYEFKGFIPGDYTVRFIYGDKAKYNTEQYSPYTTFTIGDNTVDSAYNGLFYQSTKANPKTNEAQFWYANEENTRYSDAYDEVSIRTKLNESLQEYTYQDIIAALKRPTDYMAYAYTSLLEIYPEKAKTETVAQEPGYTISNVDFGLTPRTQSNLDLKKEVTHVKLILQNGIVQFDADTETIREQGVPGVVQAAQGYDINITMSSELVNGATLEITYALTVTNNNPKSDIKYYKDSAGNTIAIGLYNEDASQLVYCEDAIRTYANEEFTEQADKTYTSKVNAGTTQLIALDSSKTQVVEEKARAMAIADFVPNNLNFIKNDYTGRAVNDNWDLYNSSVDNSIWGVLDGTKKNIEDKYYRQDADNEERSMPPEVNDMETQMKEIYDSNAIVLSNENNPLVTTDLKPGESVSTDIVLSKVISVNSDSTDTKSYKNKARILKIYNSESKIQDMVGTESEKVIISDPTGIGNKYIVIALALVVFVIIGSGALLIKKFAIPKR